MPTRVNAPTIPLPEGRRRSTQRQNSQLSGTLPYAPFVSTVSAKLSGHAFDLDALCERFVSGDPIVAKKGDNYFLVSERLNRFADDASALYAEAATIVRLLNGVGRAAFAGFNLIELSGTFEVLDSQGFTVHQVVAVGNIELRARVTAAAVVTRADETVLAESTRPSGWKIALVAGTNPHVYEVLELLAAPKLDWGVLYKIYEVLRDAVGRGKQGLVNAGLMTVQEQSAFTGSANHPVPAVGPPAMPGSQAVPRRSQCGLPEGEEFIRRVVNAWVETLPGSPTWARAPLTQVRGDEVAGNLKTPRHGRLWKYIRF